MKKEIDITESVTRCSHVEVLSLHPVRRTIKPPKLELTINTALDNGDAHISQVNHLTVTIQLSEGEVRELIQDLEKALEELPDNM